MLAPGTESVLALVSGLAPGARERRMLLMLQAYIDESGTDEGPTFVLAGFLASTENWLKFSADWQAALDMKPPLKYLKMRDAANLNGQFYGWTESQRDERMSLFFRVLEDHVPFSVLASVQKDAFRRVFKPVANLHTIYRNPYYILFFDLIGQLSRDKSKLGISDKIDFIFDEGGGSMEKIMEAWEFIKANVPLPQVQAIVGSPPSFKDDKEVLPLQAADVHAWFRRQRLNESVTGKEPKVFSFKVEKPTQHLNIHWSEDRLRAHYIDSFCDGLPRDVLIKLGRWPWPD